MTFIRIGNSIINSSELTMIEILSEKRNDEKYGILIYFHWRSNIKNPYIKGKVFEELEDVEKFKSEFFSRLGIDEKPINVSSIHSAKDALMQRIANL